MSVNQIPVVHGNHRSECYGMDISLDLKVQNLAAALPGRGTTFQFHVSVDLTTYHLLFPRHWQGCAVKSFRCPIKQISIQPICSLMPRLCMHLQWNLQGALILVCRASSSAMRIQKRETTPEPWQTFKQREHSGHAVLSVHRCSFTTSSVLKCFASRHTTVDVDEL